jgi:hypothetical protein
MTKPLKTSQNQFILNHLIDHGYITDVVARNYGIRRLASRVFELKAESADIKTERLKDDAGVPYAKYTMDEAARAVERMRREQGQTWKCGSPKLNAA